MIKKFNKFNEDYGNKPGEGVKGSTKVTLTNLEVDLFNTEPALQQLISNQKVSLYSDCVWFDSNDAKTIDVLMSYLDNGLNRFKVSSGVIESLNESNDDKKKRMMGELTDLSKRIKELQKEYDKKIKDVNDLDDKIEKVSYRDKMRQKVQKAKKRMNETNFYFPDHRGFENYSESEVQFFQDVINLMTSRSDFRTSVMPKYNVSMIKDKFSDMYRINLWEFLKQHIGQNPVKISNILFDKLKINK